MIRVPPIPPIIGCDFQHKVGQTDFRKVQRFGHIGDVRMLVEKHCQPGVQCPKMVQPSLYPQGPAVPAWIVFNKETLTFDGYFQEALQEFPKAPFLPRYVKIYYYLEDGTIQVMEPRTSNSGLHQGVLIKRQRIPLPRAACTEEFVDVIDLNVGKEVELYGRVFKITNCDNFTRNYLNRNGISVPDPVSQPKDPYMESREMGKKGMLPKKPKKALDDMTQFLKYDRCVLRFYGYWDDRESGGELHRIILEYYLADDSILVKEQIGRSTSVILSRQKLPMEPHIPFPGENSKTTVLNVLMEDCMGTRYIYDALNCGEKRVRFYTDKDLALGCVVNVMGRTVVLCSCDKYTQEYYRKNYGIDSFTPIPYPDEKGPEKTQEEELPPPYNGFGSFEDSLNNCKSIVLKPRNGKDLKQYLLESRDGLDGHVLRFNAKMITKNETKRYQRYLIRYFLEDDTISVTQMKGTFEGCFTVQTGRQLYFSRDHFLKPGEDKYGCRTPAMYKAQDCYVGATLILNSCPFYIYEADEYTMRYMELHSNKFPLSNIHNVLDKVRNCARPRYRQFLAALESNVVDGVIPFCAFRKCVVDLMQGEITEHEILTLARKYRIYLKPEVDSWQIRQDIHCHLKRLLYVVDKRALTSVFKYTDEKRTGRLPRKDIITCLKSSKVPLTLDHMHEMFKCITPAEDGSLPYQEIIDFLDFLSPVPCKPANTQVLEDTRIVVDMAEFLKELGLEGAPPEC